MATAESAGRPPLPRTASTQSTKSATSVHSNISQSSQQSKSKSSSAEQPAKSEQGAPKSPKSSPEKLEHARSDSSPSSPTTASLPSKKVIDMGIFNQILELDDDESREFSQSMVNDYYSQVDATLIKMDKALESKNLEELSDLGHFLKGSSAALGVELVQAACERIQHAGKLRDEEKGADLTKEQALELIMQMLDEVKIFYPEAREELDRFFKTPA